MDETHATDAESPLPEEAPSPGQPEPDASATDETTTPDRPADVAILHALDAVPGMPVAELTSAVDADPTTVDHLCHRLQSAGYVRPRSDGSYSITARGEQYLRTLLRQHRARP